MVGRAAVIEEPASWEQLLLLCVRVTLDTQGLGVNQVRVLATVTARVFAEDEERACEKFFISQPRVTQPLPARETESASGRPSSSRASAE